MKFLFKYVKFVKENAVMEGVNIGPKNQSPQWETELTRVYLYKNENLKINTCELDKMLEINEVKDIIQYFCWTLSCFLPHMRKNLK